MTASDQRRVVVIEVIRKSGSKGWQLLNGSGLLNEHLISDDSFLKVNEINEILLKKRELIV